MKKSLLFISVLSVAKIVAAATMTLNLNKVSNVTFPNPGSNSTPGINYFNFETPPSILSTNLCLVGGNSGYYNGFQSPIVSNDNQISIKLVTGAFHRQETAGCVSTWFNSLPNPIAYTTDNMAPTEKNLPSKLVILMMGNLQFTSNDNQFRCDNIMFGTNDDNSKNWYAFTNINNPVNGYPIKKDAVVAQCYLSGDNSQKPVYFYFKTVGGGSINIIPADSVNQ